MSLYVPSAASASFPSQLSFAHLSPACGRGQLLKDGKSGLKLGTMPDISATWAGRHTCSGRPAISERYLSMCCEMSSCNGSPRLMSCASERVLRSSVDESCAHAPSYVADPTNPLASAALDGPSMATNRPTAHIIKSESLSQPANQPTSRIIVLTFNTSHPTHHPNSNTTPRRLQAHEFYSRAIASSSGL